MSCNYSLSPLPVSAPSRRYAVSHSPQTLSGNYLLTPVKLNRDPLVWNWKNADGFSHSIGTSYNLGTDLNDCQHRYNFSDHCRPEPGRCPYATLGYGEYDSLRVLEYLEMGLARLARLAGHSVCGFGA
jgi:hypothetical protein